MAYTIDNGTTPTLAVFQKDLLKLAEIFGRGQYPAQILAPGTIDHLKGLSGAALTTSIIAS